MKRFLPPIPSVKVSECSGCISTLRDSAKKQEVSRMKWTLRASGKVFSKRGRIFGQRSSGQTSIATNRTLPPPPPPLPLYQLLFKTCQTKG